MIQHAINNLKFKSNCVYCSVYHYLSKVEIRMSYISKGKKNKLLIKHNKKKYVVLIQVSFLIIKNFTES